MKAMLQSEFAIIRSMGPSLAATFAVVCVFICWAMKTPAMMCAVCAMYPMIITFSLMGYDTTNGWERYRAALPLSRRDIIAGRYASVLVTSVVAIVAAVALGFASQMLLAHVFDDFEQVAPAELASACVASTALVLAIAACMMPFMVKFGNTKGVRYAACAFMLAFCLDAVIIGQFIDPSAMLAATEWIDSHGALLVGGLCAAATALYAASCAISMRIFQKKDL